MNIKKLKDAIRWKGLKSLEFRILGWMVRGVAVFAFVTYLFSSATGAWSWARIKWVRTQEISRLDALLARAADNDDFGSAEIWMQARPLSETGDLQRRADPYYNRLSPFVFFDFSSRAARRGDDEKADLWNTIAHLRLRFDLLRCGLTDGVEHGRKLIDLLSLTRDGYYRDIPEDRRRVLAEKALAFDAAHPAVNNPERLCAILGMIAGEEENILPREQWDSFRRGMHETARITLKEGPLFLPPDKTGDKKKADKKQP